MKEERERKWAEAVERAKEPKVALPEFTEAEKSTVSGDAFLDAYCAQWLHFSVGPRMASIDMYKESWVPFCDAQGVDPGSPAAFTRRMSKRANKITKGGKNYFLDVSLKARYAPPHLRVVGS